MPAQRKLVLIKLVTLYRIFMHINRVRGDEAPG